MDDPRAAEGVEHLQRAARELLQAARSFLDVVEDVVEDPDRLTGAAAGLVDVVRSGLGRQDAPWVSAAWDTPPATEDDTDSGTAADETAAADRDPNVEQDEEVEATSAAGGAAVDLSDEDADAEPAASVDEEPAPARRPGASRSTSRRRPAAGTGTSRVRRISVD